MHKLALHPRLMCSPFLLLFLFPSIFLSRNLFRLIVLLRAVPIKVVTSRPVSNDRNGWLLRDTWVKRKEMPLLQWGDLSPGSSRKVTHYRIESTLSRAFLCGPLATILTRFVYRRGRVGRARFHRYFKGNSEGKKFGNEQSRRLNLDVSFDRSWRESKGGFWRRMQQETLVTTSVLHKYFNRRLFHVLPIPCDFR